MSVMTASQHRRDPGLAILSAGFRPFFLASAIWAAVAVPLWLAVFDEGLVLPTGLPPVVWHVHEMVFGYAAATVTGFLLTAIPNWTGRLPLRGRGLAVLVALWAAGRIAVLLSGDISAALAAVLDLSFPAVFAAVVAREIVAGHNWRNLPMIAALLLLFTGNLLVHLAALGITDTALLGNRIGIATLLCLIALVGGRIVPSFTRNWLVKQRPAAPLPAPAGPFDLAAFAVTVVALAAWAAAPYAATTAWATLIAGAALLLRLARWRGNLTFAEPLLLVLHVGYAWLACGLLLVGIDGLIDVLPPPAAVHALTVGAIGTMTLAVMTRATLGHTGRKLSAGPGTQAIYGFVTLAALLRVLAPLSVTGTDHLLWLAGISWSAAFGLFAILYGPLLVAPRGASFKRFEDKHAVTDGRA